jgi:hypothetical protein
LPKASPQTKLILSYKIKLVVCATDDVNVNVVCASVIANSDCKYAELNVVLKQLHEERIPSDARLNLGDADIVDVVLTITYIAGKLQSKLTSGSVLGSATIKPHYVDTLLWSTKIM